MQTGKLLNTIFKVLCWVLIALGVGIVILGFLKGFTENDGHYTDVLLKTTYWLFGITLVSFLVLGLILGLLNNPKGILKLAIFLVLIGAFALIAYILAPGKELVGYLGEQPTPGVSKLADATLYLTYFAVAGVVLAIIVGGVYRLISGFKK